MIICQTFMNNYDNNIFFLLLLAAFLSLLFLFRTNDKSENVVNNNDKNEIL